MKEYCYNCKKEIANRERHNVKIIDYKGESFCRYVCSEQCFNESINKNYEHHYKRCLEVKNQKFV